MSSFTVHFGVVDIPYGKAGTETTGEVAEKLEEKYGVLGFFATANIGTIQEIAKQRIIDQHKGIAANGELGNVAEDFRRAIDERFFDGKIPGVATQASKDRLNNTRRKKKNIKRKRKTKDNSDSDEKKGVSFVDTGHYQNSIKVWIK